MKTNILKIIILTSLLGCQNAQSKKNNPENDYNRSYKIDASIINDIKSEYLKIPGVNLSHNEYKDVDFFSVDKFLEKIHPWFRLGIGLKGPVKVSEEFEFYELKEIPEFVIDALNVGLLQERFSLAVITKEFWNLVSETQNKGFRIGFISHKSPRKVSGVYFHSLNFIGLDIFSEPGTLPHELRHVQQFRSIEKYKNLKTNSNEINDLSEECLRSISSAVGELDATSSEMIYYKGIENELDFNYFLQPKFNDLNHLDIYPQVALFNINMSYPYLAIDWVLNSSCSQKIKQNFSVLRSLIQEANSESLEDIFESTSSIVRYRNAKKVLDEKCAKSNTDECSQSIKKNNKEMAIFAVSRSKFIGDFAYNIKQREIILNDFFTKTELKNYHTLFCKNILGYNEIADCTQVIK